MDAEMEDVDRIREESLARLRKHLEVYSMEEFCDKLDSYFEIYPANDSPLSNSSSSSSSISDLETLLSENKRRENLSKIKYYFFSKSSGENCKTPTSMLNELYSELDYVCQGS